MPNLTKALNIPGWMEFPELEWLGTQAETHTRILEVGSFCGRSTRALADNTPGVVFAVDTWQGSPEIQSQYGRLGGSAGVFGFFRENLADILGTKVIPIITPSVAASQLFPMPVFDMIFIDGSHDFYSVLADISCWGKVLKAGGLLCGHDYRPGDYPGLIAAVDSLIPNRHLVPDTTLWYATLEKELVVPILTPAPDPSKG